MEESVRLVIVDEDLLVGRHRAGHHVGQQLVLAQHHFRSRPWSEELIGEMDLETSLRIYQERFADFDFKEVRKHWELKLNLY